MKRVAIGLGMVLVLAVTVFAQDEKPDLKFNKIDMRAIDEHRYVDEAEATYVERQLRFDIDVYQAEIELAQATSEYEIALALANINLAEAEDELKTLPDSARKVATLDVDLAKAKKNAIMRDHEASRALLQAEVDEEKAKRRRGLVEYKYYVIQARHDLEEALETDD